MRWLMIGGDVRGRAGMSRGRHDVSGGRAKECGVGPDREAEGSLADASNCLDCTCSHTLSNTITTHQHQKHQIMNTKTQTCYVESYEEKNNCEF